MTELSHIRPMIHKITDYKKPTFKVHTTHLMFNLHPNNTEVIALYLVEFLDRNKITDIVLNGDSSIKNVTVALNQSKIDSIAITTNPNTSDSSITLDSQLIRRIIGSDMHGTFTISVSNNIDPSTNTELQGMYMSNNIMCTHCEPNGFRRIVYSFDRPDIFSRYIVSIQFDPSVYPTVLSNGDHVDTIDENKTRTVVYNDPHPKPSYLFALVAGNIKYIEDKHIINTAIGDRTITVRIYSDGNLDHLHHALRAVLLSMKWDEKRYGLFYDLSTFNIVCLDDFNMGAMENKGINIFNSKYIRVSPSTAIDNDYKQVLSVVGHEYFHNWTGNRVTVNTWFELTLKEGLTVFRDQNFSLDHEPMSDYLIIDRASDIRTSQFVEDSGKNSHPIRPSSYIVMDNFYTSTVYDKGAEIVRIYETTLGIDGFRRGMDLYFQRHDGMAVRCEEFWQAMYDANINTNKLLDQPLKSLFNWYHQLGTPELTITYHYDNISKFTIECHQSNEKSMKINGSYQPVLIPISLGLIDRDTKKTIHAEVLHFCQEKQTFIIDDIKSDCVPSLMRNFSAPVKIKYDMSYEDILFIIKYDSNLFVRWDRIQHIHSNTIIKLYNNNEYDISGYLDLLKTILTDDRINPYIKSRLIRLPRHEEISLILKECDPLKLHMSVSSVIISSLANYCAKYIETKSNEMINNINIDKYDPYDNNQAMNRVLFGLMLNLRLYIDKRPALFESIFKVFKNADNLTVKNSCIGVFAKHYCESDEIRKYFDAMLKLYCGENCEDSLMISKRLKILSSINSPSVINRISDIFYNKTDGYGFKKTTPNHLNSLLFTHNPYAHFINEKGIAVGYETIAKLMMDIDKYNSHVSSRIGQFFDCEENLPKQNRELMKNIINEIKNFDNVSVSLKEILHI